MAEEITKSEILESIKAERKLLEDQVKGLREDQMLQPTLEAGWTIKDILAHIVTWEERMVQWLQAAMRDEIPQMLPTGMTWDDLDLWNEQTFLENRDKSLSDVISGFHSSHLLALEVVESIPEKDLNDPGRFEWREGRPLWPIVSANTHWHYSEHREQIAKWLEKSAQDH